MRVDTDLKAIRLPCRANEARESSCAPEEYVSPLAWDGADNMVFRPLSELFAVEGTLEAANVNSIDEVPDSAWFTNRLGTGTFTLEELERAACRSEQVLEADNVPDGSWLVDQGKPNGATPGFRVNIAGKGKYLFKSDAPVPERPSAASVIGAAAYHASGFYTSCEQIVYFKPSLLKLAAGLRFTANFGGEKAFDQKALDEMLSKLPRRGELVRMQASAWLAGRPIGPFRYEGTRADDPHDVIPHQHRRELRGGRLLAAWLNHFDAREQNTMDSWIADGDRPDAPGRVIHHYLDTSDCLGSEWAWDGISRRLGHSYVFDWGDIGADFVTLGIPRRPWELVQRRPGREIFGYFDVEHFVPEAWKMEYPNPAFSRMTERDGAWMARILARFTPQMVASLAKLGRFSDPGNAEYLSQVLEGRLERILMRYLTRLSPISQLRVHGTSTICGLDLARWRGLRKASAFRYSALLRAPSTRPSQRVSASVQGAGGVCFTLPHLRLQPGLRDDAPERYVTLRVESSAAQGALLAHLYDLGPRRGYRLAGLERPEP